MAFSFVFTAPFFNISVQEMKLANFTNSGDHGEPPHLDMFRLPSGQSLNSQFDIG